MAHGLNLDLKVGKELHTRLKEAVWNRYRLSRRRMTDFHEEWEKAEERFIAYLPETDADAARRVDREEGTPKFTTIEVPYSYAVMMTMFTYWSTVFLARDPIHQLSARHGETQQQVLGFEACLDYQVLVGRHMVPYFVWLLDTTKYGLGIVGTYWTQEQTQVSTIEEVPMQFLGEPLEGKTERRRVVQNVPGYTGNKIFNVRPFDFYPDPRVSVREFQRGEFCGRTTSVGWNEILRGEEEGRYINVADLRRVRHARSREDYPDGSGQLELPDEETLTDDIADVNDMGYVDLIEMTIDLSAKEWGLGSSNYPEKWQFTLANEAVVIEARPLGNIHGEFPFQVQEFEVDGYQLVPRSPNEIITPLTDVMTWLFNSHFHNVRKVLNDQLVYDPSRISTKDLKNGTAGRLLRLRPEAYGTDPRSAIHQLQVTNVTASHLKDAQVVEQIVQRVTGVTDNIMGQVTPGGRKTATEIRTSSSFGVNRLKMHAEYMSAMGWAPLNMMLVQNTQQYYDGAQKFKIAGDLLSQQGTFVEVTPELIAGFYDFVPVDGTLPVDKFALANLWKELMAAISKIPQLQMGYDLGAIFAYTARLAGAKNIEQFKVNVSPDQQLAQQAAAGNLVPIGGNAGGGTEPRRDRGERTSPPGTPQIGGLGPAG